MAPAIRCCVAVIVVVDVQRRGEFVAEPTAAVGRLFIEEDDDGEAEDVPSDVARRAGVIMTRSRFLSWMAITELFETC